MSRLQPGNKKESPETFLDVYSIGINDRDVAEKIEDLRKSVNG